MIKLLALKSTYLFLRVVGFSLLIGYLAISHDFSFSIAWVFGYFAILAFISWMVIVVLNAPKRFPELNRYHFFNTGEKNKEETPSENEWVLKQAKYFEAGFRNNAILLTPAEDALICVPVIMVGIGPMSAVLGGFVFGVLHLGRFTYLDCIGKAIIYSLVCLLVLPHGLLTVIAGHFGMDLLALAALKATLKIVESRASHGAKP